MASQRRLPEPVDAFGTIGLRYVGASALTFKEANLQCGQSIGTLCQQSAHFGRSSASCAGERLLLDREQLLQHLSAATNDLLAREPLQRDSASGRHIPGLGLWSQIGNNRCGIRTQWKVSRSLGLATCRGTFSSAGNGGARCPIYRGRCRP